jgi:hypothetical protein
MKVHIMNHLQECQLVWIHPTQFILTICVQGYIQLHSDRKTINVQYSEYYPVVESMVQWQGESFPTWITTSPAPDLADSSVTTHGNVYIGTMDMHMPSAVRPIQRHGWCRLLGFGEERICTKVTG